MSRTTMAREIARVVKCIPYGKVATYGQVALLAGNPRDARAVGWALSAMSEKHKLPWQRVINREGKISLPRGEGYELQKAMLEAEGVVFDRRDKIDLNVFRWVPKAPSLPKSKVTKRPVSLKRQSRHSSNLR
jgi:methylated-DNA-protein-cysteine methyltransferase related protein